jgi:hypothetical protein
VSDLQTPTSRSTSTTLIVCDDDTTLIRLRHYLERGGVRARATRLLQDAWREAPRCAALVLMADDFDLREVAAGLYGLCSRSPTPFVIIVTSVRQHFEPTIQSFDHPESVVIIPKPAWGWTILDLIRSRLPGQA